MAGYAFKEFANVAEFNTWHATEMSNRNIPDSNMKTFFYVDPINHPTDGRLIANIPLADRGSYVGLQDEAWAIAEGFITPKVI